MNISNIITSVLTLFGIDTVPETVQEYMWAVLVLCVGLYIVKYCMIFVISLMKEMVKMR